MKRDRCDIEKMLLNDAEKIEIDYDFKKNLKKQIMSQCSNKNIVDISENRKKHKVNRYLKIASSFAIVVLIGGTFVKVNSNTSFLAKNDKNNTISVSEVVTISKLSDSSNADKNVLKAEEDLKTEVVNEIEKSDVQKNKDENNSKSSNITRNIQTVDKNEKEMVEINNNATLLAKGTSANKNIATNKSSSVKSTEKYTHKDVSKQDNLKNKDSLYENKNTDATKNKDSKVNEQHGDVKNNKDAEGIKDAEDIKTIKDNKDGKDIKATKPNGIDSGYDFDKLAIDNLLKNQEISAASPNLSEDTIEKPHMENIKEENNVMTNCYDSRYSKDYSKVLLCKKDGIYSKDIKTGDEIKIVDSQNAIIEKPNYTPDGDVIYAKIDKTDSNDVKWFIYKFSVRDSSEESIVEGKDPMVSKDGSKVAYEFKGKICIKDLKSGKNNIIDDGKYPSWSADGNFLSYVKIISEKETFDKDTQQKNVYVEKKYSTVWIYDIKQNKEYAITNKEFVVDNDKLNDWANKVVNGSECENFDLKSKYTYYESMWSEDGKELYVIRRDNEREIYELVKFNLN
ncbi:hypothetical protein CLTEP_13680 [Clostridium tepidiprofundi DSM 19306]|uniref:Protein TolB n=1 Tax=Clostridium tepidiprofundi DSM 19306 TaxID=1121338 RepID=A0A151B405_9CLOT|nr:hypothetical protein [Clostridium tepidiprofundi]KYH34651.1 hypothetical protein CLTEP_13680 [Clostridium tepidiprofundi DSM 19306]